MHKFYEWMRENFYQIDGENAAVQLDKDIKLKGNMVYSPDTCLFVPRKINAFFGGIHGQKNIKRQPDGSYIVTLYNTPRHAETYEQAENIWKGFIEGRRAQLLTDYEDKLPHEVYQAIAEYEF